MTENNSHKFIKLWEYLKDDDMISTKLEYDNVEDIYFIKIYDENGLNTFDIMDHVNWTNEIEIYDSLSDKPEYFRRVNNIIFFLSNFNSIEEFQNYIKENEISYY